VRAAQLLGFYSRGTAPVRVEYVGPAPLRGSDDRVLAATLRENAPAPSPSTVRLAAGRLFPPTPPPASAGEMVASASRADRAPDLPALRGTVRAAPNDDDEPPGMDGTAQVLNGRGLY